MKNERAASGGADEERRQPFKERVLSKLRNPGTGGNAADYKNWALSVDGGSVFCYESGGRKGDGSYHRIGKCGRRERDW